MAESGTRSGVIAGGNWIVDQVKMIDAWPEQDALASIGEEFRANGGAPYNLLKDLARLGATYPLEGIGLVGDDDFGRWIRDDCRVHRIDTAQLRVEPDAPTSFTDVMTVTATGRRTFFHQRGANARLAPSDFDFSRTRARFFHLGYLMLLDTLDRPGPDGRPAACAVLEAASRAGLLTSVDLVSAEIGAFTQVVGPVLPLVDYLFLNDFEAARVTGLTLRGKSLDAEKVRAAAEILRRGGVRRAVFIHFPEGACCCDDEGTLLWQPSVDVAPADIRGAAGAGDAFAAGVLHALHEGRPMGDALLLGVAVAASSLSDPTCSGGILDERQCIERAHRAGFKR
ncbi:MAG TPA: carbohydrate kinase family protein [Candidatus Didemnitutus sp.]|nr:carbohydrate kinase family protein [Candidatus Didemnitutus sp.]